MTKIDYITASFGIRFNTLDQCFKQHSIGALKNMVPDALLAKETLASGKPVHRTPYKSGLQWDSGFRVFWGGQDTIVVELTGLGCSKVNCLDYLDMLKNTTSEFNFLRVTRLDIASDYLTDTTPFDAVAQWGINPRIKAKSVMDSASGQTFYVGSRKSGRFCRVYRYAPPHPRAKFLRCEFQFNKSTAQNVVDKMLGESFVSDIYNTALHKTFDSPESTAKWENVKIGRTTSTRENSNTVQWFYKQVAPAIAKLIALSELTEDEVYEAIKKEIDNR